MASAQHHHDNNHNNNHNNNRNNNNNNTNTNLSYDNSNEAIIIIGSSFYFCALSTRE